MKACVYHKYGSADNVMMKQIACPEPGPEQVLIRVIASTVNRTDTGFRSAEYVVSRLFSGLLRPKLPVLGCEFAGIIESVGSDTSLFKPGQAVFGYDDLAFGCHAEYKVIDEKAALCLKPENLSFEQAAALTEGAHYALCDIRASGIKSGDSALIYGATGAIGSAAVQLLRTMNVDITAVCGTNGVDIVHSLGARRVIDYMKEDFTQCGQLFNLVFDAVGKAGYKACKNLLRKDGIYISTEPGPWGENIWRALAGFFVREKKVLFPLPEISKTDVEFLAELARTNQFIPLIDRIYAMEDIQQAHRYAESGKKTGSVILSIAKPS
jgi:NADPH:quinone reductase-like Zn-dependent oxidoreductase